MYFHRFLFHDPKVTDSIFGVSATLIGVMGTFVLGFLALFGDWLKKILFKPEIKGVELKKTFQEIENQIYIYHRLIVKNIGSVSAKEVRVLLTYFDSSKAENFIPAPLNWTHWNTTTRDISRKEPVYIDVLCRADTREPHRFCYSCEVGTPLEPDLVNFDISKGNLRLEFYERDNKVGDIILTYLAKEDKLVIV
jgi:hypothetical protein